MGMLLIHSEKLVQIGALTFLTKVTAGSKSHRQAVIDANLFQYLTENLVKGDSKTKKLAATVISNSTFENNNYFIEQLIQNDAIGPFCALLKSNNKQITNVRIQ